MAKYKPAKTGKKPVLSPKAMGAIPCLVVIFLGFLMIALLLYGMMTSR
ncbi:MAG: hypothetical protein K2X03_13590 [Bryobacteraceae bacterium]|nr:hypothetical protein [Bryobacteraceae bacterium]